jgi:hypothetical protein
MNGSTLFISVSVFLSCSCLTTQAQNHASVADAASISLEQDTRLDRPVSLEVTGISVAALLRHFTDRDLLLTTDANCAELKLQLRLQKRPLRSLLQSLASLVPGTWQQRPDGKGYAFHMDGRAISSRKEWWQLFLSQREEALAVQRASVLQQLRATPQRAPSITGPNPEGITPEMQNGDLKQQRFFHSLPASLQERIASQMTDFANFTGFYTHGANEGATVMPVSELPQASLDLLRSECAPFWQHLQTRPEEASITFTNVGTLVETSLCLPNGITTDTSLNLGVHMPPGASMLRLEHPQIGSIVKKLGGQAPRLWKALAVYQQRRIWPNDAPLFPLPKRPPHRADVLEWLGTQANMEYVADYYSRPGFPLKFDEKKHALTHSLKEELDMFAASQDSSWKQSADHLYLVRHNRWYRDDLVEVPNNLLQRWAEQLRAFAKVGEQASKDTESQPDNVLLVENVRKQISWEAEVATTLTPWQIAQGLTWAVAEVQDSGTTGEKHEDLSTQGVSPHASSNMAQDADVKFPFSMVAIRLLKQRYTVMFFSSLDTRQQTALLQDALPISTLTAPQFERLAAVLPHLRALARTQSVLLGLSVEPSNDLTLGPGAILTGYDMHLTTKSEPSTVNSP